MPITCRRDLAAVNPLWIDLLDATPSERQYVGERFGLTLPAPGEATDLEVSSRFIREEHGEIRLHSNFLLDRAGDRGHRAKQKHQADGDIAGHGCGIYGGCQISLGGPIGARNANQGDQRWTRC